MGAAGAIQAGQAFVRATLETADLDKGLVRMRAKIIAWQSSLAKISGIATGGQLPGPIGALMRFAASPAGVFGALTTAATLTAKMSNDILILSEKVGISTEKMSALGYMSKQFGVTTGELATGMKNMARALDMAARGNMGFNAQLATYGIFARDLRNLAPEEQFRAVADSISKIANPTQRAAAAIAVFGRWGSQLMPVLMQGSDGIRAWEDRAKALGITIDSSVAKSGRQYIQTMKDLWEVSMSAVRVVGGSLIPVIEGFTNILTRVTAALRKFAEEHRGLVMGVFLGTGAFLAFGIAVQTLSLAMGLAAKAVSLFKFALDTVLLIPRTVFSIGAMIVRAAWTATAYIVGIAFTIAAKVGSVAWTASASIARVAWLATIKTLEVAWKAYTITAGFMWQLVSRTAMAAMIGMTYIVEAVVLASVSVIQAAWVGVAGIVAAVWTAIAPLVTAVWGIAVAEISSIWEAAAVTAGVVWSLIAGAVGIAWAAVAPYVQLAWTAACALVEVAWTAASVVVMGMWEVAATGVQVVWEVAAVTAQAAWEVAAGLAEVVWTSISAVVLAAWEIAATAVASVWSFAAPIAAAVWAAISGVVSAAWAGASFVASVAWTAAAAVVAVAWSVIAPAIGAVWNSIAGFVGGIWTTVAAAVGVAWAAIGAIAGTALAAGVAIAIAAIILMVTGLGKKIVDLIDGAVSAVANTVSAIGDGIANGISKAASTVQSLFGFVGQAASVLGKNFSALWSGFAGDAMGAFGVVSKALSAGDFEGAIKIVTIMLRLEWQRAMMFLEDSWEELGPKIKATFSEWMAAVKTIVSEIKGIIADLMEAIEGARNIIDAGRLVLDVLLTDSNALNAPCVGWAKDAPGAARDEHRVGGHALPGPGAGGAPVAPNAHAGRQAEIDKIAKELKQAETKLWGEQHLPGYGKLGLPGMKNAPEYEPMAFAGGRAAGTFSGFAAGQMGGAGGIEQKLADIHQVNKDALELARKVGDGIAQISNWIGKGVADIRRGAGLP